MFRTTRMSIGFVAACLLSAMALAKEPIQHAHELEASTITLPSTDPGLLTALPCSSCKSLLFNTTNTTEYRIGKQRVTLVDMKRAFQTHPGAAVLVNVTDGSNTVLRVVLAESALTR